MQNDQLEMAYLCADKQ